MDRIHSGPSAFCFVPGVGNRLLLADLLDVEPQSDFFKRLRVSRPLRMVIYSDKGSVGIKGVVASLHPLCVRVKEGHKGLATEGTRVLLFAADKAQYIKAESEITSIIQDDDEWTWTLRELEMSETERRKYDRRMNTLPVELKAVQETPQGSQIVYYKGESMDLSMGGAWVKLEQAIELGSLVEFRTKLPSGEDLKVLATVSNHGRDGGFGIEFMDFSGNSRTWLFDYLEPAA